jgi:hypothetical protein
MRDEETDIEATESGPGVELVSEVSDLAAGVGMITFMLAPLGCQRSC